MKCRQCMAFNVKQTSMVRETCLQPTLSDVRRSHVMRDLHDSPYTDSIPSHMRLSAAGQIHAEKVLHQAMGGNSNGKPASYEEANSVPLLFEPGIQHRFPYDQHHINEQYFYGGQDAPPIIPVPNHQRASYSLLQSQTPFLMKGHDIPSELLTSAQNCELLHHEGGYPIGQNNANHPSHRFSSNSVCDKHRIKPYSPCELEDVSYLNFLFSFFFYKYHSNFYIFYLKIYIMYTIIKSQY